jgi:iron complex outermembrane recepter protein
MNFQQATNPSARRAAVSIFALAASLGALAAPASAQDAAADEPADREIVVTGTLLRGVAPGGSNVVALGQEQIQSSGVQTTAQLLATIPQLGSFGTTVAPLGIGGINVNRPNLRSLPGFNTGGGSTTLVLLDGHRVVGMGNISTTPDPDFIPPGAIQRVDVVPDGGSAIYGSDAVAGVMNFITRRDFDGLEANARYGFGDDYYTLDLNGTVGRKWDGGSAFVSYAFSRHDGVFGRDRDFVQRFATSNPSGTSASGAPYPLVTGLTCPNGNVQIGSNGPIYGLPFTTATAAAARDRLNTCDTSDYATLIGPDRRHSVMAGLEQELTSNLSVSLRANYFNRRMATINGPFTAAQTATPSTLGFAEHRVGTELSQTVLFQYGGAEQSRSDFELDTWGVNAEFTYNPGGDWRIKFLGNYGQSHATEFSRTVDSTALRRAVDGGLFNPYNWQASNPAALATLFNFGNVNDARQRLVNFRAVGDGSLFALPGGNVKLALGGEFIHEGFNVRNGSGVRGQILSGSPAISVSNVLLLNARPATRNRFDLSRDIKAVFGELSIPVFGADNEMAFFRSLTLSASGRYDYYGGGVGGTFNPKFGINWKPVEGIRFRGAWGKAFNAPSLADLSGATLSSVNVGGRLDVLLPTDINFPPASVLAAHPITPGQTILTIGGNSPGIEPQTGTTLSLGVDLDPTFVPGLHVGVTYWSIRMKNLIQRAPTNDRNQWWINNADKFEFNPSAARVLEVLNTLGQTGLPGDLCPQPSPLASGSLATQAAAGCVYAIADARKANFGKVNVSGLDFDVSYRRDTGFGSVDASWQGTLELVREQAIGVGAPFVDQLPFNNNKFRFTTTLGANVGDLRTAVTWNYRQGYARNPAPLIPGTTNQQLRIGDYNVFNMFFKYDVNGENMFKDLSFTLNVDNVFDKDPPIYYGTAFIGGNAGYENGFTLGRVFTFGVSKKF